MKSILFCILVCIVSTSQYKNNINQINRYIPYQAHGFNDLDYFIQLLVKGVSYFKMDVSPQVYGTCSEQSTWDSSMNECEVFSSHFKICCLAFRGDTSSTPIFNQAFNHSMELINLLQIGQYDHIFKNGAQYPYNRTISLAFNFQYNDPLALITQNFIYSLMKTIEDYDLNIQILSGSDSFIFSYLDKCQSNKCTKMEQYITNAPIYLQSSSQSPPKRQGEQRYRNFNVFYREIENFCRDGFPDWIDTYNQPIIFWEPSHEYQVQFTRKLWESKECRLSDNLKSIEKLRIASNLEPEMVQVYWKKPVFNLDNSFDSDDEKVVIQGDYSNPSIEYMEYCGLFVMVLNTNSTSIVRLYDSKFNTVDEMEIPYNIDYTRAQDSYILLQGKNTSTLINFARIIENEQQCQINSTSNFSMNDSELVALSAHTNQLIFLNFNNNQVDLSFASLATQEVEKVVSFDMSQILRTPILDYSFDAYFSPSTQTYHIAITFSKLGSMFLEQVSITSQVKVYLSLLELNTQYEIIDNVAPVHHVDFGTTAEVKLYEFDGQMYLLAVHTNGLCQSAILLNNNEWNKCNYENLAQYAAISNVKNTINYIWGRLDNIKQRVESGQRINGCDLQIMHAKVGNGQEPSISLRVKNGDVEAFVISEFIHYKEQTPFTQLFCGSSNDYDIQGNGVIMFSFDLVNPKQLNQI